MDQLRRRTDIPVLLLYNIDSAWDAADTAVSVGAVKMLKDELRNEGHPVIGVPVVGDNLPRILEPYCPNDYVVFNWCEELPGRHRSDSLIAEILETLGFVYTGAPPDALAFSWDKAASKELLNKCGIPTPAGKVINSKADCSWDRFPAIVKPAWEHCSLGISPDAVVMNRQELEARIAFVRDNFNQAALVETFIDGREFHVTLWGNGDIHMLPAAEMDFSAFNNVKDRLCTYDAKFTPGSTHYEKIETRIPGLLDPKQLFQLEQTSIKAYRAIGCRDYARIDLRMENDLFYVLDVNPNADFSPDTSLVYAAEAAGLSYGVFASHLVNLAAQRHPSFSEHPDS
jgi:D-alanine-D-alanine ligase